MLIVEVLIGVSILAITLPALFSFITMLPGVVQSAQMESSYLFRVRDQMRDLERMARDDSEALVTVSTSSEHTSITVQTADDESILVAKAEARWMSIFRVPRILSLSGLFHRNLSKPETVCDPFTSGDWANPKVEASYALRLGDLLQTSGPAGIYTLSSLAVTPTHLAVTVGSTSAIDLPTLWLFRVRSDDKPYALGGFDNASTSRIGYTDASFSETHLFAVNGFSSSSSSTCAYPGSCDQLHVFTTPADSAPERISTFRLPHSLTASGEPSPGRTAVYRNGYLYIGTAKTASGMEFHVVDVTDPTFPVWRSGFSVGRSINSITIRGSRAYLATDDPSRELIVLDIRDPGAITLSSSWNAPGSSTFGYGSAVTAGESFVRFGRTYISGQPELLLLGTTSTNQFVQVAEADLGTNTMPESVRALLTQDRLTYALLRGRLSIWQTNAGMLEEEFGSHTLPSGSEGVALACRNQYLYVGRNDAGGGGYIDVLSGSTP